MDTSTVHLYSDAALLLRFSLMLKSQLSVKKDHVKSLHKVLVCFFQKIDKSVIVRGPVTLPSMRCRVM